jgi:hypothetical protein
MALFFFYMLKKPKTKYRNVKVEYEGERFDSQRELARYLVLQQAERDGLIQDLERQPTFILLPAITENYVKHLKTKNKVCVRTVQHPITYRADFRYTKNGEKVVEDVKISPHLLPKEFSLKMKLLRYFHGICVHLIYKPNDTV